MGYFNGNSAFAALCFITLLIAVLTLFGCTQPGDSLGANNTTSSVAGAVAPASPAKAPAKPAANKPASNNGLKSNLTANVSGAAFGARSNYSYALGSGRQGTLAVIYEWGDSRFWLAKANVSAMLFGKFPSLADFYSGNSYGKASFSGDVIGPVYMGDVHPQELCGIGPEAAAVMAQVHAHPELYKVNFTRYRRIIFIRGDVSLCNIAGGSVSPWEYFPVSTPDGPANQTWVSVTWQGAPAKFLGTAAHELGISLGMTQSGFMDCNWSFGNGMAGWRPGCRVIDGGDLFSSMGPQVVEDFSAGQKQLLGWLGGKSVAVANLSNGSASYLLMPVENTAGLREVILPYGYLRDFNAQDPDARFHYGDVYLNYTVEYRKAVRYDGNSTYNYPDSLRKYGVFLMLSIRNPDNPWSDELLIDAHPPGFESLENSPRLSQYDAAMHAGEGFHDNSVRTSINVISEGNTNALVKFVLDPENCTRSFPLLNITKEAPGEYSVWLMDRDSPACGGSNFSLNFTGPGLLASPEGQDVLLAPGANTTRWVSVSYPRNFPSGFYSFYILARNENHYYFISNASAEYTVEWQ